MAVVKCAACQMDIAFENPDNNYLTVERMAEDAAAQGVDVLILPEMFSTGFTMNEHAVLMESNARVCEFLCECASKNRLNIIAGFAGADLNQSLRNVALAVDRNGTVLAEYFKTYLFSPMLENRYYKSGSGTFAFAIDGVTFSLAICYDLRFPELFRTVASSVDVFVILASWPLARQSHWETLLRARAIENQCYVIGVNRIGSGGGLDFTGGSAIIGPSGKVIASLLESEGLVVGDVDGAVVKTTRVDFPVLQDIRRL